MIAPDARGAVFGTEEADAAERRSPAAGPSQRVTDTQPRQTLSASDTPPSVWWESRESVCPRPLFGSDLGIRCVKRDRRREAGGWDGGKVSDIREQRGKVKEYLMEPNTIGLYLCPVNSMFQKGSRHQRV